MKLKLITRTQNRNEEVLKLFGIIPVRTMLRREKELIQDKEVLDDACCDEKIKYNPKLDYEKDSLSVVKIKYTLNLDGGKDECGNLINVNNVYMDSVQYFKRDLIGMTRGGASYPIEIFKEMWKLGDVDKSSIDFTDTNTIITLKYLGLEE